jgi:ElaB/YqjD/DUF883 family membrane-anchored ribosome-binding protein
VGILLTFRYPNQNQDMLSKKGEPMEPETNNPEFMIERDDKEYEKWRGEEFRGRGQKTFDRVKTTLADRMSRAAQKLHEQSSKTGSESELSSFGNRAADWLDRSADYVKEVEPQRLKSDIETQVRRNPGRSLLIAGAVGLVLGSIFRRR